MVRREIWTLDEITENQGFLAFHGSPHKISKFTNEFVGSENATDQEGPGIYFTTSFNDAERYAENNGYVHTVKLNTKKLLDESPSDNVNLKSILWLIKQGDDWESNAQNWSEDPETGAEIAASDFIEYNDKEKDVFLQVWYDFYRYDPTNYVKNMVKLGIDGIVIDKPNLGNNDDMGGKHIIVYNPDVIEIRDIEKLNYEDINEFAQVNKQDVLQNYTDASDVKDGGYAFNAVMPQSVNEINDDYANVSISELKKSVDFVERLDANNLNFSGKKISKLLNLFFATSQNIEKALKIAKNDKQFFNNLILLQNRLKKIGLLKEDLVYYSADDATDDQYEIGINENVVGLERKKADKIANYVAKKIYDTEANFLDSGNFGYAYEIDDKVIKVTTDRSEAVDSLEIKGKNLNRIANVYNAYNAGFSNEKNVYVIVLEKLNTSENIEQIYKSLDKILENYLGEDGAIPTILVDYYVHDKFSWNKKIKDELFNDVLKNHPKEKEFLKELLEIADEVQLNDISSTDYINYSNLGYKKNGNLAFFDLGFGDYYKNPKKDFKKINIDENIQQMEKNFIKTGLFNEEDKKNVLNITNGDNYTYQISKLYAWLLQIKPYDRGEERKNTSEFNSYYKKDLYDVYLGLKNYDKNIFPILENDGQQFDPANSKEHPIEIWSAIKRRNEIIKIFNKIPQKYYRNLKYITKKPHSIIGYDYYLKNEINELNEFLKKVNMLSEEKKEKIFNKIFSSKNKTIDELLNHIRSTDVLFLDHEDGIDELIDKVEYESETDEAEILYQKGDILVVDVKSSDAMKTLGCGSQWCFATESSIEHWQNYADNSHVNIVYNFNFDSSEKKRMVVVLPYGDVYDMYNDYIEDGWEYLEEIGAADHINVNLVNEDGTSLYSTKRGLVNSDDVPFHLQEAAKYIHDDIENSNMTVKEFLGKLIKKLGYNPNNVKNLGSGGQGYAYDLGNDVVMKITADKSEAIEANKLVNKENKHIGKFYNVYKIKEPFIYTYVILREKLDVNALKAVEFFNDAQEEIYSIVGDENINHYFTAHNFIKNWAINRDHEFAKKVENTKKLINKYPNKLKKTKIVLDIYDELKSNNIESSDFWYENFGFKKDGNIAYYDVGYSPKKDGKSIRDINLDERKKAWMPNSQSVKVKEKCRLGGKGDGTSEPCNQGDIGALEISKINEGIISVSELLEFSKKTENKSDGKIQFGALMINFDIEGWDGLISKIKEEDLYEDGSGTFGREDEPHVTVLYGFHDEVEEEDFYPILEKHGTNFELKGKKISLFENEKFDVVKIDIEKTEELLSLREEVEKLPHTTTYKDYHPHVTIAYVKSGRGKKYVMDFNGKYLPLKSESVVYSKKDKTKSEFFSEEINYSV